MALANSATCLSARTLTFNHYHCLSTFRCCSMFSEESSGHPLRLLGSHAYQLHLHLRLLKAKWSTLAVTDPDHIMLWAACCLGFCGFMRAGEFTVTSAGDFDPSSSLCTSDISVDNLQNPAMVCVVLRQSETDPFRKGITLAEHTETYVQLPPSWHSLRFVHHLQAPCLSSKTEPTSPGRSSSIA